MSKKIIVAILCLIFSTSVSLATENLSKIKNDAPSILSNNKNEFKETNYIDAKKKFNYYRQQEKEKLYKALELTQEQIAKAEKIDEIAKPKKEKAIKELHEKSKVLKSLKVEEVGIIRIKMQQRSVKKAYKKVKNVFRNSQKDFEKLLTAEQKEKFIKYQKEKSDKLKLKKLKNKAKKEKNNGQEIQINPKKNNQ